MGRVAGLTVVLFLPITVNVRNPNTFRFQTQAVRSIPISVWYEICLKSEQKRLDFRHKFLFEIRTKRSNVRILDVLYYNV